MKNSLKVNVQKRKSSSEIIQLTHLLHEALREVLGNHVEQKGSLVCPDYLRFDFTHFSKLSEDELNKIETKVNLKIKDNISLQEHKNIPIKNTKKWEAYMLFGEKYGDTVRGIQYASSIELCGGTHVSSTIRNFIF